MNRLRDLQLSLPEMRVPLVLSDLFHDLRDRRLLPLVALILVALAAVPFLLSSSGSEFGEVPRPAAPEAEAGASSAAQLTVVRTDHGLRQPSKRLRHLSVKDPFHQQFTGPAVGTEEVTQTSSSASEAAGATSTSTSPTTETGTGSGGAAPASPPSSSPSEPSPSQQGNGEGSVTVFTFAADLKLVKTTTDADGKKSSSEPETLKRVLPSTTLPGKKTQVLTYLGISPKTKKPLFLVGEEVTSIFGEADCVAGSGNCQLIELEKGFPVTLVYGPNDVRFKITVLHVEPVTSGHF
jgi:hypothetical protein